MVSGLCAPARRPISAAMHNSRDAQRRIMSDLPPHCSSGFRRRLNHREETCPPIIAEAAEYVGARRGSRPTGCETRSMRHRDTETQRILDFLCVSVPLWPIALCLAGRVEFQHGLLTGNRAGSAVAVSP